MFERLDDNGAGKFECAHAGSAKQRVRFNELWPRPPREFNDPRAP